MQNWWILGLGFVILNLLSSAASADPTQFPTNDCFSIVNVKDGYHLEVLGGSTTSGEHVITHTQNGKRNQLWRSFRYGDGYYLYPVHATSKRLDANREGNHWVTIWHNEAGVWKHREWNAIAIPGRPGVIMIQNVGFGKFLKGRGLENAVVVAPSSSNDDSLLWRIKTCSQDNSFQKNNFDGKINNIYSACIMIGCLLLCLFNFH